MAADPLPAAGLLRGHQTGPAGSAPACPTSPRIAGGATGRSAPGVRCSSAVPPGARQANHAPAPAGHPRPRGGLQSWAWVLGPWGYQTKTGHPCPPHPGIISNGHTTWRSGSVNRLLRRAEPRSMPPRISTRSVAWISRAPSRHGTVGNWNVPASRRFCQIA